MKQFPTTLFSLCLESLASNLNILGTYSSEGYTLHKGLFLHRFICEEFLKAYQDSGKDINDSVAHLFKDVTKTSLKSVNIHDSSITGAGLKYFLRHNLYELNLKNCTNFDSKMFARIFKYSKNLQSLVIGPRVHITGPLPSYNLIFRKLSKVVSLGGNRPPSLKLLALKGMKKKDTSNVTWFFRCNDLSQLNTLDFSYSKIVICLQYTKQLPNLHTLILFEVPTRSMEQNKTVLHVCELKSLVVLDLSRCSSTQEQRFKNMFRDEYTLALIVKSLPNLMSLDISGTNLAGRGPANSQDLGESSNGFSNGKQCDIPGLESRVENPLEYLGLYHTMYDACNREHIPAKTISGNANEEQLITAFNSFMHDKPELLAEVLNDITNFIEQNRFTQLEKAVHMVIDAITTNIDSDEVQKSGISALFRLMYKFELTSLDIPARRQLYHVLETGIGLNIYDDDVNYKLEEIVAALNLE
ncbi:protein zer-1 homolog isoform X3 [Adelges cooleyi]|uniref:protein zer-1 homolog isoform X3 n=1 Tax=Adelges cooleyi TaxID=133065 RepID=UPI00217FCCFD|nr:protein zer-1 homolog isoform X3 [Adelges cooleyi]